MLLLCKKRTLPQKFGHGKNEDKQVESLVLKVRREDNLGQEGNDWKEKEGALTVLGDVLFPNLHADYMGVLTLG